ncbi:antibiotic biosynthesis monooxygenase [Nocardioides sp. GCM10027113]|uniref:antibiotic biosynthesis monooxygenase n=1 Tax=unclassified Nocardioides TaxID=2615069 RepID=UPI00360BA63B
MSLQTPSAPVTVSITRHIAPEHHAEMVAWVEAGTRLAERFDGFLGAGWVRPRPDSDEWHMLYRFASAEHLAVWQASSQRKWWLAAAQGRIEVSRMESRTGIEGWFDEPRSTEVIEKAPSAPTAPPRWKQATTIFLVFYPLSVLVNWFAGQYLSDITLPLRILMTVLVMTPVMTYFALPWITRKLQWWLQGKPAPWRRR